MTTRPRQQKDNIDSNELLQAHSRPKAHSPQEPFHMDLEFRRSDIDGDRDRDRGSHNILLR